MTWGSIHFDWTFIVGWSIPLIDKCGWMHIITYLVPIIGVTAVLNICLTLLAMCSVLHNCSFVFCAPHQLLAHNVVFSSCHGAKPFLTFSLLPWLLDPFFYVFQQSPCTRSGRSLWLWTEPGLKGKCILDWRARSSVSLTITEGVDQA